LICKLILTYYGTLNNTFSDRLPRHSTRLRGRDIFAAVGDSTRRRLLELLANGEMAAGEMAAPFAISRPAVSQHLSVLRRAGLVSVRRRGREQIYGLCPAPIKEIYDWAEHYQRFWNKKLSALGKHLDSQP
jgi:DNA-binding transcriptional ArsR family regulator